MHHPSRLAVARRYVAGLLAALVVAAACVTVGGAAYAQSAGSQTLYGTVVDTSATAVVVSLASNGQWVAVNVTPQTVVSSQGGPAATGTAGIAVNDWALVTYTVERSSTSGQVQTWLVASSITYSIAPIATGGQTTHVSGRVTGLLIGGGFAVTASDGTMWSVTVTPQTTVLLGATAAPLAFLQVGDLVQVWGTAAGHAIVATRIVYRVGVGGSRGRKHGFKT